MSVTLYFSKVSLNSHIFEIYEEKIELKSVLKTLYLSMKEGIEYINEGLRIKEDGEKFLYDASYRFNFIEKPDGEFKDTVMGSVIKTAKIFINDIGNDGQMIKRAIDNKEIINFYFDVYKEIVVFHTTNRFGYKEFNMAFKELLNKCMSSHDIKYNFEMGLIKKGLNVQEIKQQLSSIGRLEYLKIEVIPPNPDDELLKGIQENGEEYFEGMKAGNVTEKSILFTSLAPEGLNINSEIINKELEGIDKIHSKLSSDEATKMDYVSVEAKNQNGRVFSTKDNRPVKYNLDERPQTLREFAAASKQKVAILLRTFL
ncbi:hypothetical protein QUF84_03870 [Fictibacillus enclensis]|uniref:hypothetical protein n=1 Tax=Fictibacillus enclensis TaxID=1017270 RepID=UPI0025A0BA58|nr:hypothetical protein [Fictibacillus enclensis]MDM5336370.1 hypothetical protein [Fictibacillus enclensis]